MKDGAQKLPFKPITPGSIVYVGKTLTSGPFSVQLSEIVKPEFEAMLYAAINVYYKGVLTNTATISTDSIIRFATDRHFLYVKVSEIFRGAYIYNQWARIQLGIDKRSPKRKARSRSVVYDFTQLHPKIREASEELFKNGHYSQAIFDALKEVEILVRSKSRSRKIGKDLMMTVFKEDTPILRIKYSSKTSEKEEQEGFKFIFAGAMLAVKDPKSHARIVQKDPIQTFEYLVLASLLARKIEESRLK